MQPVSDLLKGPTIRLTAITPDDIPTLARWYQDGLFMRLFDAEVARPKTAKEVEEYVTGQQKAPNAFVFAARPLDSDFMIAYVELDGINWAQRVGWISIAIGDSARRNQGYGTEAMRLLLQFAFDEVNLRRVQLTVFSYNPAAMSLYEKLGFRHEGTFREFLERDGRTYDMLLYGLLRREWEPGAILG